MVTAKQNPPLFTYGLKGGGRRGVRRALDTMECGLRMARKLGDSTKLLFCNACMCQCDGERDTYISTSSNSGASGKEDKASILQDLQ